MADRSPARPRAGKALIAGTLASGLVMAGALLVAGSHGMLGHVGTKLASAVGIRHAFASTQRVVTSAEELRRALDTAPDGSTIALAAGHYPSIGIGNIKKAGTVTVTSADPDRPAVIGRLLVRNSAGLTFRNIELAADASAVVDRVGAPRKPVQDDQDGPEEDEAPAARKGGQSAANRFPFMILQSERITFDRMNIHGPADNLDAAYRIPALMVRASRKVTISNSRFSALQHGIAMLELDGMRVLNNEFHNIRTDGVRGGEVSNLEVAGNVFTDFHPAPKDHPDAIQLWSTPKNGMMTNIHIHDNLVVRGTGYPTQGVFLRDVKNGRPFQNVVIEGNLVMGGLYNGIAINGVQGGRITDNVVLNYPDRKHSWIRAQNCGDIDMRGNRASRYIFAPAVGTDSDNKMDAASPRDEAKRVNQWLDAKPGRRRADSMLQARLTAPKTK
ncbi:right-handed parallel beta-helix repeat-containing protein [Sphingobium sp. DEHP117]|uniref:right-handed parallel beta-helix repeat-containing protein n=1 Tax=Sphingobium sp. DEHP117 TaxID=2993436 RepID=UPI0027D6A23E|nr:right-handed parallel beta-helix repeat-containing protein [Sphingobium sp. DEHP117]MDQ4420934.1 right-handed parallel beta-helix repeat-containing protein [Sphingobium sp. DEHP117]